MKEKIKIESLLDVIIYVSFYVIIWLTTHNLTLGFIKQKELLNAIQMRDVQIVALATVCEMDSFLFSTNPAYKTYKKKQGRPDLEERE